MEGENNNSKLHEFLIINLKRELDKALKQLSKRESEIEVL